MDVVVKLEIDDSIVPDREIANSYVKEQLQMLEKSGIVSKSIFPLESEDEVFSTFLTGRNDVIASSVQKLVELLMYSSDKGFDADRNFEDVDNIVDGVCEYIEQILCSEVCRPFKGLDGTPCYKTEDCKHPKCPFKL